MRLSLIRLHRPFGRYFRRKRFRQFLSAFKVSRETRVLDVGGLQYYWQFSDLLPRVTTVNLEWPSAGQRPGDWVIADARMLPFREKSFEVAFSNSVIEHISDPVDRQSFARELGRVAERYYVQTPNFGSCRASPDDALCSLSPQDAPAALVAQLHGLGDPGASDARGVRRLLTRHPNAG